MCIRRIFLSRANDDFLRTSPFQSPQAKKREQSQWQLWAVQLPIPSPASVILLMEPHLVFDHFLFSLLYSKVKSNINQSGGPKTNVNISQKRGKLLKYVANKRLIYVNWIVVVVSHKHVTSNIIFDVHSHVVLLMMAQVLKILLSAIVQKGNLFAMRFAHSVEVFKLQKNILFQLQMQNTKICFFHSLPTC